MIKSFLILVLLMIFSGCATNYQENCKNVKANVWICD